MDSFDMGYTLSCAVNKISLCMVCLNDANQSLSYVNPKCSNGVDVASVYFGINDTLEDVLRSLQEAWRTI